MPSSSFHFKNVNLNRKYLLRYDEIVHNNSADKEGIKILLENLQNLLISIQKDRSTLEADPFVKDYNDKFKIGPGAEVALEMVSKPDYVINDESIKFKAYILYYYTLLVDPRNISTSKIDESYSKIKKNILEIYNKPVVQYLYENLEKLKYNSENVFKLEKLLLLNTHIFNDSNQGEEDILVLGIKDISTYLGFEENKNKYWIFILSSHWISLIGKTIAELQLLIK